MPVMVAPCLVGTTTERGFACRGEFARAAFWGESRAPLRAWAHMATPARRLRQLPVAEALGLEVSVATGIPIRLLGLAHLDRKQAGRGLLIPRCSSVHTFGMRFPLDLVFLDGEGKPLAFKPAVPPRRFVWNRGASAVLELPAPIRRG